MPSYVPPSRRHGRRGRKAAVRRAVAATVARTSREVEGRCHGVETAGEGSATYRPGNSAYASAKAGHVLQVKARSAASFIRESVSMLAVRHTRASWRPRKEEEGRRRHAWQRKQGRVRGANQETAQGSGGVRNVRRAWWGWGGRCCRERQRSARRQAGGRFRQEAGTRASVFGLVAGGEG